MIFQMEHVVKKYGAHVALNDVSLSIQQGAIYGLIGENGAGKTTLIRILCGLAYPTQGKIYLFGDDTKAGQVKQRKRMGCLVESPALYPDMTAEQNLEVHRLQRGIPGKDCIQETLTLVGLENTGHKKAKNFSLGMRQRLALAIALLSKPEFLVLDEPTNGLDPMGIVELRELLLHLNQEKNMTILISSHILSEMYQLATDYGILHKGKFLEQITKDELNEKCKKYLSIQVADTAKASAVIEQQLKTVHYEVTNQEIRLYAYLDQPEVVLKVLADADIKIKKVAPSGEDLEGYFTSLIRRS